LLFVSLIGEGLVFWFSSLHANVVLFEDGLQVGRHLLVPVDVQHSFVPSNQVGAMVNLKAAVGLFDLVELAEEHDVDQA
jgi:hypothetical protein